MALPLEYKDCLHHAKRMRSAGHHKESAAELKRAYHLLVKERYAAELALSHRLEDILEGMHVVNAEIALIKKAAGK